MKDENSFVLHQIITTDEFHRGCMKLTKLVLEIYERLPIEEKEAIYREMMGKNEESK